MTSHSLSTVNSIAWYLSSGFVKKKNYQQSVLRVLGEPINEQYESTTANFQRYSIAIYK